MKLYLVNNGVYHRCETGFLVVGIDTLLFSEYWLDTTTGLFRCIRAISFPNAYGKCTASFPEILTFGSKLEKHDYEKSPTKNYYVVGENYLCKYKPEYEKYSLESEDYDLS